MKNYNRYMDDDRYERHLTQESRGEITIEIMCALNAANAISEYMEVLFTCFSEQKKYAVVN